MFLVPLICFQNKNVISKTSSPPVYLFSFFTLSDGRRLQCVSLSCVALNGPPHNCSVINSE